MKNKQQIFTRLTALCSLLLILSACTQSTDNPNSDPATIQFRSVNKFEANSYSGNDKIKYSFSYDDYDFYYIYLGELENIPMFFQTARYHSGTDWTYTFTKTESMTNSVRNVVTESSQTTIGVVEENTKSKTNGEKLAGEIKLKLPLIKMVKAETKINGEINWSEYTSNTASTSFQKTKSLTNTVEHATSYTLSTMESDQFHLNSSNKAGYYRYTMFSASDVYLYVIKNSKTNEIYYEFREYVIPDAYFWCLDYSETPSFRKSDATGFELDISILNNLPKPGLNFITYTIEYNANGGSGTMGRDVHGYGIEQNLLKNNFTPPSGYSFAGWARTPNATNVEFSDGELVVNLTDVKDATVKLYAVWSPGIVTLERAFRAGEDLTTSIPANVTLAKITGIRGTIYTNARIVVLQRTLPLTIEIYDVYAVGQNGTNGGVDESGGNGRPVIYMGANFAPVPNLTIDSKGSSNKLYGGDGGNGGQGTTGTLTKRPGVGKSAGHGATAIVTDRVTIIGDITLGGGNGGEGGRGGNKGAYMGDGNGGGNGGNGGVPITANNLTVNNTLIAPKSKGGLGGEKWNGSALQSGGRAASGSDGRFLLNYTGTGIVSEE